MPSTKTESRPARRSATPHPRVARALAVCLSLALSLALSTALSIAATPAWADEGEKRVTLGRTDQPPVIDGVMDDPGWLDGGLVTDLRQVLPDPGGPPSQRTEIRIVTDGETLYVGFRCWDTNPELIVRNRKQRDTFSFWDDRVSISIDPFFSRRNGYFFTTNPNAMRHDVLLEAEEFEVSWDTIWQVETSVDAEGWTAEFAIPFSSIALDTDIDQWGINFERGIRRNDEDLRWSNHEPQNQISYVGVAGTLDGVGDLDQGIGVRVTPGLTLRRIDGQKTERFEIDPTFDAFYRVLPSVNAIVTANTDFGQVEVDDVQINDDRFALFFPEKRDFFLEDGLIFDFGDISQNGRPFFSRRIGFNAGGPARILAGGKVTGRLGPVKFGVLNTWIDETDDPATRNTPAGVNNGTDARNLFVGRAAVNILGESTLGMIVTHGNPDGGRAVNASQGTAFNETTRTGGGRSATTIGADFLYRNTNFLGWGRTARASVWWAKSIESGLDGSRNNGYGIKLEYPNDRISWLVGFEELQEDYAPRMGFVNRNDIRHWFGSGRYRQRYTNGSIRTIDSDFFGQVFVDSGNELETVRFRLTPAEFTTPIGDGFDLSTWIRYEDVDSFIPTFDIPFGTYTFWEVGGSVFTSRNRPVRLSAEAFYGTFFDGTRTRFDADLEIRPSHYLNVGLEYEFRDVNLPQSSAKGPRRRDRDTQLVRLKFDINFTPNVVWSNFIQYDSVSDAPGLNSRFRYILRDGREFFLVVNQEALVDDDEIEFTRTETIVKAVWTLTF